MIVVDVGCREQGPEHSTDVLIDWFRPWIYFGFDPDPDQGEGIDFVGPNQETSRVFRRAAAWVCDGTIGYSATGIGASVIPPMMEDTPAPVACFDFPAWLAVLPPVPLVVKFDCEGAEYEIIAALIDADLDTRIELMLVEWHREYEERVPDGWKRKDLEARLRCQSQEW